MKKYISLMAIAIVAIFASCSNDDITITTSYTINVNASGVVSPFIEASAGELEKFTDADERLRIRVLVYNSNGELTAQETGYYTNYNTQLKASLALSTGNYTVIGISDVVLMNGSSVDFEFWTISGMSKLSELQILDQGYVGYEARILGIAKYSLTIGDNQSSSLNVDLQPAGALVYGIVWHAGNWTIGGVAVNTWRLNGNKSTEGLSFDASGNYSILERYEADTRYRLVDIDATEDGNFYYYNYILPMNNLYVNFRAVKEDGTYTDIDDYDGLEGVTLNIQAGEEYACHLDMYGSKTYYKRVTSESDLNYPGSASSRIASARASAMKQNKTAKMPKEIFNQFTHELRASDIKAQK
ncbi:MAG: hypothetical protein IJV44_04545 [Prevotella sp.]|nr:hypothetical protein [Prevotella sp.]